MRIILEWTLFEWDLIPCICNGSYKFADDRESYGVCFSFLFINLWFIRA